MSVHKQPGDRITWALGGLFDNGIPRVVCEGEVRSVTAWGYTAYKDGCPRAVSAGEYVHQTQPFFMSVAFEDVLS